MIKQNSEVLLICHCKTNLQTSSDVSVEIQLYAYHRMSRITMLWNGVMCFECRFGCNLQHVHNLIPTMHKEKSRHHQLSEQESATWPSIHCPTKLSTVDFIVSTLPIFTTCASCITSQKKFQQIDNYIFKL